MSTRSGVVIDSGVGAYAPDSPADPFFLSALGVAQTKAGQTMTLQQVRNVISNLHERPSSHLEGEKSLRAGFWGAVGADVINAAFEEMGVQTRVDGWIINSRSPLPGYHASLVAGETYARGKRHWREGDAQGNVIWDPLPGARIRTEGVQYHMIKFTN